MSVMDMNSRMAMAEKLSVQQLQQAIQSGSLPAYIGIPLIEQKNKERSQMAAAQPQKPQSVASQILQQADQGVAQLPSNLPEEGMAGGGIVAFADGGDAEDFDYDAYVEQQDEDEYSNSLSALVAAAQAAAEEGVSTKKKDKKYADGGIASLNDGGAIRFQDTGQVVDPDAMSTEDPLEEADSPLYRRLLAQTMTPVVPSDTIDYSLNEQTGSGSGRIVRQSMVPRFGQLAKDFALNPNVPKFLKDTLNNPAVGGRSTPARIASLAQNPPTLEDAKRLSTILVTPETASPEPQRPSLNETDYSMNSQEGTGRLSGEMPRPGIDKLPAANTANTAVPGAPKGGMTPVTNQVADQTGKPRSAYDDFLDEIKEGRKDLKTQAEKDKYMALISAGLGMMSGTSPNAFANIGQGAQAGVASYMASGKQRASEKAALNKNLLMGRRYQSMEDIANRTADINEARYAAIAAARGAGSGASTKAENLERQKLNDIGNLYQRRYATLSAAAQKIDPMLDKEGYAAAMKRLQDDPLLNKYNSIIENSLGNMYGITSEAPPTSTPSNVMRFDAKGQLIK